MALERRHPHLHILVPLLLSVASLLICLWLKGDSGKGKCHLFSGPFHILAQLLLGVSSLLMFLLLKGDSLKGKSNRSTTRFWLDTSKQLCGALWMHAMNIIVAYILGTSVHAFREDDPCEWYLIEIMIDTTLGVYVEYQVLQTIVSLRYRGGPLQELANGVEKPCVEEKFEETADVDDTVPAEAGSANVSEVLLTPGAEPLLSGTASTSSLLSRGKDIIWRTFFLQVAVWLGVVTVMKVFMLALMVLFAPQLLGAAVFLLSAFKATPLVELYFVMVFVPIVMDAVQFYLQDKIFIDVDYGRITCTKETAWPQRRGSGMQLIRMANAECDQLRVENKKLRLDIRGLKAELIYERSGFLARIITSHFENVKKELETGLYRVTKSVRVFQRPVFPLQTLVDETTGQSKSVEAGSVIEIDELETYNRPSGTMGEKPLSWTFAKIVKQEDSRIPADRDTMQWIILVNHKGARSARKIYEE